MNDKPILQDPPEYVHGYNGHNGPRKIWVESKHLCDQNPGQWVLVPGDHSPGQATSLRAGANGFDGTTYQIRASKARRGRVYIFIRRITDGADA